MANGKVDVRTNQVSGKARMKFYRLAPEQLEIIQAALEQARLELGTNYDSVALEGICLSFLNSLGGLTKQVKTSSAVNCNKAVG